MDGDRWTGPVRFTGFRKSCPAQFFWRNHMKQEDVLLRLAAVPSLSLPPSWLTARSLFLSLSRWALGFTGWSEDLRLGVFLDCTMPGCRISMLLRIFRTFHFLFCFPASGHMITCYPCQTRGGRKRGGARVQRSRRWWAGRKQWTWSRSRRRGEGNEERKWKEEEEKQECVCWRR